MPSKEPPPVLHDCAGWSPYQQQTSVARVIESPMPAMLLGRGGEAVAAVAPVMTVAKTARSRNVRLSISTASSFGAGGGRIPPYGRSHTPSRHRLRPRRADRGRPRRHARGARRGIEPERPLYQVREGGSRLRFVGDPALTRTPTRLWPL